MDRPSDLPDYHNPPVDEVAIGLLFKRIEGLTDAHIGLLWQRMRDEYPKTQSRPRSDMQAETLLRQEPVVPQLPQFRVMPDNISNRLWLISDDDAYLLQVQDSQFLHNWRRRGDEYPHLDTVRDRFWDGWDEFNALLVNETFEVPSLEQLEVTYFNWVTDQTTAAFFEPARAAVLRQAGVDENPEEVRFRSSYLDLAGGEAPVARLGVEVQPAFRALDGGTEWGHRLTLTYRARLVHDAPRAQIDSLIRRARDVIVRSFTEITTAEAHEAWGRFQ